MKKGSPPGRVASRRWPALAAACALCLVAAAPQFYLWAARGRAWQGAFLYFSGDENTYAAYVNALMDGRPRRNDPYTGRDEELDAGGVESVYSVQLLPAYALALAARALRVSASAILFVLLCATPFVSALVLFRLIEAETGDARLAAAGALFILCLGSLACGYYFWNTHLPLWSGLRFHHMPFLRRYQPALPLPVFFAFCALARRALASARRGAAYLAAACAGLCLAALVFTYFYMWTAAAAWLAVFALAWLAARGGERRRTLPRLCVVVAPAAFTLVPYRQLIAHLAAGAAQAQALTRSHAPDLLRIPEAMGLAVLLVLFAAWRRGRFAAGDARALFAASFALLPFVVFNQQIVTGVSLQPIHYDAYCANYCALLAVVLAAPSCSPRRLRARLLLCVALAALAWASLDTLLWLRDARSFFRIQDEAQTAGLRLAQLGRGPTGGAPDTRSIVFTPYMTVADFLPTLAPQPALWAQHTFVFSGASAEEEHERLLQYLYYSGADLSAADTRSYETLNDAERAYIYVLLGHQRVNPNVSAAWRPLTHEEIGRAFDEYSAYAASFDRARAARFPVSYLLAYDGAQSLPNFDRFYERDAGERVGGFTIYRVRLREQ